MAKIKIEDDCNISPHIKVKDIPNPQAIYPEIKEILISRCGIKPRDINESLYDHKKGNPENVHIMLNALKKKDKYTQLSYSLDIFMVLKPTNKGEIQYIGDVEIKISGKVETTYPQESKLQKTILWDAFRGFYEKVLYGELRDQYMEDCKKHVIKLRDGIQSFFNLLPKMS